MIFNQINEQIKEAIKSRNQIRMDVLRMLKSKILAADARGNIPDEAIIKLFKTYYGNLVEALEQAKEVNRNEIAERLSKELEIIAEFLPQTLSMEETKKAVLIAIEKTGAKSKKEIGIIMKHLKNQGLNLDGKMTKDCIDQILTD